MNVTRHDASLETLDRLEGADSLCVFVAEDVRPLPGLAGYLDWRLCGALSRVLKNGWFVGARGDALLVPSDGRVAMPRVFVIGIGRAKAANEAELTEAMAAAAKVLSKAKVENVALEVPPVGGLDEAARTRAFEKGFKPHFKGNVALLAEKAPDKK